MGATLLLATIFINTNLPIEEIRLNIATTPSKTIFNTFNNKKKEKPPVHKIIGCPQETLSITDASFEGGSYTIQAGFGETEAAAASYILPQSLFPVRLDIAEILFATSGATQTTTTEWSVSFFEGTPSSGILIGTFYSDGTLLPHLTMPPGTTGTIIQFGIDPNDPEQLVFNDNGSQTISVAFRIEKHNNQTQNPCLFGPPTNSNAFPCTDTSGLDFPNNNFLDLINCGAFGCGSGWTSFQNLPSLCRPNGDWVMRMKVTPISCDNEVGACCVDSFTCLDSIDSYDCQLLGGLFQGKNSTCSNIICQSDFGACCISTTQACVELNSLDCDAVGGLFYPSEYCDGFICFPSGGCCLPNGDCIDETSPNDCANKGGAFQGNNTACSTIQCPQPDGACCVAATGNCIDTTESICGAVGGLWDLDNLCETIEPCDSNCPSDIAPKNGDGVVNTIDLLTLISQFGTCGDTTCYSDLNEDGVVNVLDLLELISNFGPCN